MQAEGPSKTSLGSKAHVLFHYTVLPFLISCLKQRSGSIKTIQTFSQEEKIETKWVAL